MLAKILRVDVLVVSVDIFQKFIHTEVFFRFLNAGMGLSFLD